MMMMIGEGARLWGLLGVVAVRRPFGPQRARGPAGDAPAAAAAARADLLKPRQAGGQCPRVGQDS